MARNPRPAPDSGDDSIVGLLFDLPVRHSYTVSFTDQVHDILVSEIQRGRWRVGDRLPGISAMAEECGLSRCPVQLALNQLAEEGYVRQEDRRGTFLQSIYPQGRPPKGTLGLALSRDFQHDKVRATDIYHVPFLHLFHEIAAARDYQIETHFVDWDGDATRINTPDGPFGDRVCGIFINGMVTKGHPEGSDLSEGRTPLVYMGAPVGRHYTPLVRTDTYHGMYRLTRNLIALGHRRIALYCEPAYPTPAPPKMNRLHNELMEANLLEPHRRAMREADLETNEAAIEMSSALSCASLPAIREFLERFEDATAIIGLRNSPPNLVAMAQMMGRRVPEDLSIVTGHTGPYPMDPSQPENLITGPYYDYRPVIETGIDILESIITTGRCNLMQAHLAPGWAEGASLAPPRQVTAATAGQAAAR